MNVDVKIRYVSFDGASVVVSLDEKIMKNGEIASFVLKMTGIGDDIISAVDFESLGFCDNVGAIPVCFEDISRPPRVIRKIRANRDTDGRISIRYGCNFKPARRNPILDMGIERNGTMGAGENFLPSFNREKINLNIGFDISDLPENCSYVWTYGGSGHFKVKGDVLSSSYFCVGKINRCENGNFGYYWLDDTVDLSETAAMAEKIFSHFSVFFGDTDGPYRIFARCRETSVCGGTAADRSYAYIYAPEMHPSKEDLKLLFAHEIVHNWTTMSDIPYGICTWYQEGIADLYSTLLLYRNGMLTRDELLIDLNSKSRQYYENPCVSLPNDQLGKLLFKDLEATTVPYGRGFLYLLSVDYDIRMATDGKKTLDDIVKKLLSINKPDNEVWLSELKKIGLADARAKFDRMCSGEIIAPVLSCFDGADIEITQTHSVRRRTGEECTVWEFK